MTHKCHAHGCAREVPPRFLFCSPHWFATRKVLQNAVWNEYRVGQEEAGGAASSGTGSKQQTADSSGSGSGSGASREPRAASRGPSNRYLAIQRLCVSELEHRPRGNRAVATEYASQAETFRQRAIAEGAGDPFEQLARRKPQHEGQLELGLFAGAKR